MTINDEPTKKPLTMLSDESVLPAACAALYLLRAMNMSYVDPETLVN